jgi:hypothetical protein
VQEEPAQQLLSDASTCFWEPDPEEQPADSPQQLDFAFILSEYLFMTACFRFSVIVPLTQSSSNYIYIDSLTNTISRDELK